MNKDAAGWLETGRYYVIYNCSGLGCAGGNGTVFPESGVGGNFVAWMGSKTDSGVSELYRAISFPVGTTKIQVLVDINFQTKSTGTMNSDYFQVRLVDSNQAQIGAPLASFSNANAQTANAAAWTKDGINAVRDVSALAGTAVFLKFWVSVDNSNRSDFFFDNVRVIATVCK